MRCRNRNVRLYRIEPVEPSEHLEVGRYVAWDEDEDEPIAGYHARERKNVRALVRELLARLGPRSVA